jgi:excisionase family DNA binding protein
VKEVLNIMSAINTATAEKRCYTVEELQTILCVSRPTVYSLLKRNEFRWFQIGGGKYRISKMSFDEWLDKR